MAGHHDAGVHTDSSPAALLLLAEKERLVDSIVGLCPGGSGVHAATIDAVRDFLIRFRDAGIPWVRMYHSFPSWQAQSGLLNEGWDRNAVLERAKLIFTLITPQGQGGAISRKALGGGTWKSTGAESTGNQVVLSKLYYKRDGANTARARDHDGFTAFEFHLTVPAYSQPRVAICVLHPTDYRHSVRDLRQYLLEGCFPGGNQGNLQAVQHLPPTYQDPPYVAGFMNGSHVDYTINLASNIERNIPGANRADQMVVQHEGQYLAHNIAGFINGSQLDCTTNPVPNSESSGYHPPAGIQNNIPSNPMNDDMYDIPWETNMSSIYHPPAKIQMNIPSNTCPMNGCMNDLWDANTNDNEPSLEPFILWEDYFTATAHDHTQDGH